MAAGDGWSAGATRMGTAECPGTIGEAEEHEYDDDQERGGAANGHGSILARR